MDGANGLWSSICIEGAAMGNASSCVTMLHLLRLGNKKILKKYNCQYLRKQPSMSRKLQLESCLMKNNRSMEQGLSTSFMT